MVECLPVMHEVLGSALSTGEKKFPGNEGRTLKGAGLQEPASNLILTSLLEEEKQREVAWGRA